MAFEWKEQLNIDKSIMHVLNTIQLLRMLMDGNDKFYK